MSRLVRTWQSWTLLRQLVVGVSAVVMLALVTVGTMSVADAAVVGPRHPRRATDSGQPMVSATR